MQLLPFLLISLGLFALCHYFWVPAIERRLKIAPSTANLGQWGLFALAGLSRTLLLITTLTTVAIIAIVLVLQTMGGTSLKSLTATISMVRQWRDWLSGFGPSWGSAVIILLVAALGSYARRRGTQRMAEAFAKVHRSELERVEREYKDGKWEDLPPTGEMSEIQSRIMEADEALRSLGRRDQSEPKVAELRQEVINQIGLLRQQLHSLDVQRRIKNIDPEEAELPRPRNWREKTSAFFMSRGLLISVGRGSRLIFLINFILLVPSLMGVYSVGTRKMLDDHLVRLENLRIEREWQEAKQKLGKPEKELSQEDDAMLQEIARAYEAATFNPNLSQRFWDESTPNTPPKDTSYDPTANDWYKWRSAAVRGEILRRAAQRTKTPWQERQSSSSLDDLSPLEREVAAAAEQAAKTHGPVTEEGKRVYSELADLSKRSPAIKEKIWALFRDLRQDFQKPANIYDINYAMMHHVIAAIVDLKSGELGNFVRASDVKWDRGKWHLTQKHRGWVFLFNIVGEGKSGPGPENPEGSGDQSVGPNPVKPGPPRGPGSGGGWSNLAEFQSVMRNVRETANRLPVREINKKMADYPPSVDAVPEPHVDSPGAASKIEELRQILGTRSLIATEPLADSLALYQDWFPSQLRADQRTPRGIMLHGSSRSGLFPMNADMVIDMAKESFARARSFGALRGFSRVGGVLIGREPDDASSANPDFVNLDWEIEGRDVRLLLVDASGRKFPSRPHRMSLVYQALNYAADGRPVAVTMASAAPLPELKILLHPTLVDTPLGYRAIELDRFVDKYTSLDQKLRDARRAAIERVYAHAALYKLAWAQRLLAALEREWSAERVLQLFRLQQALSSIVQNPDTLKMADKALADADSLDNPELSPLTVKNEFFDESLVSAMLNHAKRSATLSEFIQAIDHWAKGELNAALDRETLLKDWERLPPRFVVWSGVREREFKSVPEEFMTLDGARPTMTFDFMLQIAFTTPPRFSYGEKSHAYSLPWEFPHLKNEIHSKVLSAVRTKNRGRDHEILDDLSEFTTLQRMFRMAFNGQLGPRFPVEKLVRLADEASAGAPKTVTRTLRWNVSPGVSDRLRGSRKLNEEEKDVINLIQEIRRLLGVAKDGEQVKRGLGVMQLPKLDQ
ncbi:MAG TPA: hypothetical protein VJZ77_18815 [Blastocatellia bacterium]|nr:hypothetical protein [Blastocatellia bacterium]